MATSEPDLARLLQLSRSGRDHPSRHLWAGQAVFEHHSVLAQLSDNRIEAKARHRELVLRSLISPVFATCSNGRHVRVQLLHAEAIAAALARGVPGGPVPPTPGAPAAGRRSGKASRTTDQDRVL